MAAAFVCGYRGAMDVLRALPAHLVDPLLVALFLGAAGAVGAHRALHRASVAPRRGVVAGLAAVVAAWLSLWILSTPRVASALAHAVEAPEGDLAAALAGVPVERRVLVVLTGGIRESDGRGAPAMERLTDGAPARAIGAARIYREQGFGLVVVSGSAGGAAADDAARGMADLMGELGVPKERIRLEVESLDTKQSARCVAALLNGLAVDRIAVVTTATHVPRAIWEMRRAGLEVVGAPVDFEPPAPTGLLAFIPSSRALLHSAKSLHEVLGRLKP